MILSANKWEHDVQGYLNLCNITDATPRKQIRDFAAGVNDLGLWNSMVCWPLRSTQNAGTGTTAYSLGGLGAFNGTLVNGPTWGVDGIAFTDTTQQITRSGFDTPPSPMTFGIVSDKSNTAAAIRLNALGAFPKRYVNTDSTTTRNFDIRNNLNSQIYSWTPTVSTNFIHKAVSITGNLAADGYVNGATISPSITNIGATGWDDSLGDSPLLIYGSSASDATIRAAFFFVTSGLAATASQHAALYNLYRATLGTGLGLP
jgi:hypothetical protein